MSSPRMKFLAVFLPVLLLLTVSEPGKAQSGTGAVSFGTVAIGQTSSALSVTLNFSAAGALATELALTKGADKQDFSLASGGSCAKGKSYPAGGSCTVSVTFAPLFAGLRTGAVVLEDGSGNVLSSAWLSGVGWGPQAGFQGLTAPIKSFSNLGFAPDKGIAVDGNGDLFVSSVNSATSKESVVEIPAGCTLASCVKQLPGVFVAVWGLAVDGAGNLWVGDEGADGTITRIQAAGGYGTLKTYSGSFGNQVGVAVDGGGNVYFTGSQAGSADSVMELTEVSGYTTVVTLATDINVPGGVAVDSSGNVFYIDSWVAGIEEIAAVNGGIPATPAISTVAKGLKGPAYLVVDGSGNLIVTAGGGMIYQVLADGGYATVNAYSNQLNSPTGIAEDGSGNLYISGNQPVDPGLGISASSPVYEIARNPAPSFVFGTPTAPGETDTADGAQKVSLQNLGNQELALSALALTGGSFSLDKATTTCTATTTLAPGDGCALGVLFTPTTTGNPISATLTITDNSLNAAQGQQTIALSGSGLYTPTIEANAASWVIALSQPLNLTVTIHGGSGNPTPTGSVQLSATGYSGAPVALSGGSAAVVVPAGSLALGQDSFTIQYQPDTAGAAIYAPVQGQGAVTVTSTILNAPTVTVTPAAASISLGQALSVTVGVSQASGAPQPTGTVTLKGGSYTSPATALSGASVTITIPANSLVIGTDELAAAYTPDAASTTIYVSAQGAGFVAVSAAAAASGAAPADFGSLGIGKTGAAQAVTLTFPADSTPASLVATTQGAAGKDFDLVAGGSCGAQVNMAAGQSCTVNVTFTPAFAGLRSGAVMAVDAEGQTLALTYVHGMGTGAQISIQSNRYFSYYGVSAEDDPFSFAMMSDGFSHPNVAVDGAGNVFVADMGIGAVREIPAGCASAACVVTILQAFNGPSALALDGAGNIFVAEVGFGDVKKIPSGCHSFSCLETVGTGFNQPYGLAVDFSGNVFVADTYNNAVKELVAEGGYTTIQTLATGLDLPWSVVVNPGGDLFVAEGGDQCTTFIPGSCTTINTSLLEMTAASGYKTVNTLAGGVFGKPFGLAVDGAGNVYEADYGDPCATEYTAGSGYTAGPRLCSSAIFIYPEGLAVDGGGNLYLDDVIKGSVFKLDFVDVPLMTFKTATLEGVPDSQDGPQVVSVQNNGTAPVTFSSIGFSDSSFQLDGAITTCSTSKRLAAGGSCYLAVDFAPTRTGSIAGTLTLTDNNLNQSPATQVIHITAAALPPAPVILANPPSTTTATSAALTFSDTQTPITFVCSIDSLPFSACASPAAYAALSGGAHSFQVKAEDSAGNLSPAAVYNWTVNSVGPPAPVITSAPASVGDADKATFTFTDAQPGVSFQCSLDGAAFASCSTGVSFSGLAVTNSNGYLLAKWHSFAVEAEDGAGNVSPQATWTWLITDWVGSGVPVNFGALPVGQTSKAQSVTFTFAASATIATIDATTMGVTGLDYAISDSGTCAVGTVVSKGGSCTLKATFTPKLAGQRKGGVVLLDAAGSGIAEAYLEGMGTGPQVAFTPYSTVMFNVLAPQNNTDPGKDLETWITDAAVDGAGDVYLTEGVLGSVDGSVSVNVGAIWEFPAGCITASCIKETSTEEGASGKQSTSAILILPNGLAMDGTGLLWGTNFESAPFELSTVGSWTSTQCYSGIFSWDVIGNRPAVDGAGICSFLGNGKLYVAGSQVAEQSGGNQTSFDFTTNTPSMTADPEGNLFVADAGNNAIKEVLASSNFTIERTVGSGFSNPTGIASDAVGNLYVADAGNNAIKEIVASSGYTQVVTIATIDPKSIGLGELTVDALGNIYLPNQADALTNQLAKLDFSDAPSLSFPTATKIGTTDTTDGTLSATVKNIGNQPLAITGLAVSSTNFSIDASATTCSASAPLAAGASCTVGVIFTPNANGALTGTLTLTDNALNASGATQQFALSGTAYSTPTTSTPAVTVAPASGSITTAQSEVVKVTVAGTSGGATPTGAVSLIGGNYTSATMPLSAGSATFTIPAGVLALGSNTLNAIYTPDQASSTLYGTGAGSATVSVTAAPTSTPNVTVTPAAIDISSQQSLAVAIAVSGGSGGPTPTGSVTLSGGNYASLASTLSNGAATITIPAGYLPAGSVKLTAYYTPDFAAHANYSSASGSGLVAVEAAVKTTPALTVTPASAAILSNQPLQVTLQVTGGSGRSTPTGSIVLSSGSYVSAIAVLSQGSVIVSIPAGSLAAGSDTLSASYTPDSASSLTFNSAAGSAPVTVNMPLVSTTTTLQASATSVAYGVSVTFSVAVAPASGTTPPTGSAALMDGASTLTTLTLNASGAASYSTAALSAGAHSITAVYHGDTNNSASTSAAVTVTVAAPAPAVSLTPSSLSFTAVSGAASAGQTATLANTGNASLAIAGISIAGTGASAFQQTSTCGAALDAGASCAVTVTFTPASPASFSATLSVADNAADSPQTVALNGTGTPAPSFTLSATTSQENVQPGGAAVYTITVTPHNGAFNSPVKFSASGLPTGATASFSPPTVTPASAAATTQMSIQTAAATSQSPPSPLWPVAGPALALIGILFLPRKRWRRGLALSILFLASLGALALGGCGGGFRLGTTSASTFTITVAGASGDETQTITVELTVQ